MAGRFCKSLAFLLFFLVGGPAFAGLTLLQPVPERVFLGQALAPLAVLVTDPAGRPLPNQEVRYYVSMGPLDTESNTGCIIDLGKSCTTTSDAQGIARTHPLVAVQASTEPATILFSDDVYDSSIPGYGFARVEIFVDPVIAPMRLSVVSGASQSTVVGTAFAQPFVVQVLSSSGAPAPGVPVNFRSTIGPSFDFNGQLNFRAVTDANGLASAAPRISMGIGSGTAEARIVDTNANMVIATKFPYYATSYDGRSDLELQDMWWGGPQQNGWGLSIAQRGDRLFSVLYAYDENGNPTWRVYPNGDWSGNARYEYYYPFQYKPKGTPYYAYDARRFDPGAGTNGQIRFQSEQSATLSLFSCCASPQLKPLVRQDFGPDVPPRMPGIGGMWWGGPSQAGWGISLMEQAGGVFAVWFTYDANGDPLWFVMPTGQWENDTTYSGVLYKTHGSPFFNTHSEPNLAYDPSKLQVTVVGTFRFRFVNLDNATFEWTAEGHSGAVGITRTEF